jgi:cobalt-zinc-cadmium efflux system outer membrane protein
MEQLQAQARIRAIEARIENEVNIAHMQYQNAQAILERIEGTLLKKAQEVRQISEYSYRRGEATFLEFLDAQRAYSEAVLAYNAARAEYARSLYAVDAVMGISVPGGTP